MTDESNQSNTAEDSSKKNEGKGEKGKGESKGQQPQNKPPAARNEKVTPAGKPVIKFEEGKAQVTSINGFKPFAELAFGLHDVSCIGVSIGKRAANQHSKLFVYLRYLTKHFLLPVSFSEGSSVNLTHKLGLDATHDSIAKVLTATFIKECFKILKTKRITSDWDVTALTNEYVQKFSRFTNIEIVPSWFNLFLAGACFHKFGFPSHVEAFLVPTNHVGPGLAPIAQDASIAAIYPNSADFLLYEQIMQHLKQCGFSGVDSFRHPVGDDNSSLVGHLKKDHFEDCITNDPIELFTISEHAASIITMKDIVIGLISNKQAIYHDLDPDYSLDCIREKPANYNPLTRGGRVVMAAPYKFGECKPYNLFDEMGLYITRQTKKA